MSDSLRPRGWWPTRLLCPWTFPGKSTGVGCHFLLQGIFLTQGSNLGLWHYRQMLYGMSLSNFQDALVLQVGPVQSSCSFQRDPTSPGASWVHFSALLATQTPFSHTDAVEVLPTPFRG